jgi:hypothetical protein
MRSPLTSPPPSTTCRRSEQQPRTGIEPASRVSALSAHSARPVFRNPPYHGGSHASVGASRTSSARRFIARSRAVFPSVSGRRAPQPLGINRSRSTPRAVSQSTTRVARCNESVSASTSVPSANALTRTRSPRSRRSSLSTACSGSSASASNLATRSLNRILAPRNGRVASASARLLISSRS